jgi:hypothetical protein
MRSQILRNNKSKKGGVKAKRPQAGWDDNYLAEIQLDLMGLPWHRKADQVLFSADLPQLCHHIFC